MRGHQTRLQHRVEQRQSPQTHPHVLTYTLTWHNTPQHGLTWPTWSNICETPKHKLALHKMPLQGPRTLYLSQNPLTSLWTSDMAPACMNMSWHETSCIIYIDMTKHALMWAQRQPDMTSVCPTNGLGQDLKVSLMSQTWPRCDLTFLSIPFHVILIIKCLGKGFLCP